MVNTPVALAAVPSPCINVCRLDADGLCIGCRRSLSEISEWPNATELRRREILSQLNARALRAQS